MSLKHLKATVTALTDLFPRRRIKETRRIRTTILKTSEIDLPKRRSTWKRIRSRRVYGLFIRVERGWLEYRLMGNRGIGGGS